LYRQTMPSYGQFCPVAKAMELLDERWTMLVIRELLDGSRHFNDLRRGVPKMSPALLSKRLQTLTRAGLVERSEIHGRISYCLTPCGEELNDVVQAIGVWGVRWVPEIGDEDLDPHLLMWDIYRNVPIEKWPRNRTVVAFCLTGVAPKASWWWLVVAAGRADVCQVDPGYDVAATVSCGLRTLTDLAGRHGVVAGLARRLGVHRRATGNTSRRTDVDRAVPAGRCAPPRVTGETQNPNGPGGLRLQLQQRVVGAGLTVVHLELDRGGFRPAPPDFVQPQCGGVVEVIGKG
jgi:DNA-binding HxlR family transcriptional regulator